MKLLKKLKLLYWRLFRPSKYGVYMGQLMGEAFQEGLEASKIDWMIQPPHVLKVRKESDPQPLRTKNDFVKLIDGLGDDKPVLVRSLAIEKALHERPEWVAILRRTKKRRIAKKYRTKIWKYYMEGLTDGCTN